VTTPPLAQQQPAAPNQPPNRLSELNTNLPSRFTVQASSKVILLFSDIAATIQSGKKFIDKIRKLESIPGISVAPVCDGNLLFANPSAATIEDLRDQVLLSAFYEPAPDEATSEEEGDEEFGLTAGPLAKVLRGEKMNGVRKWEEFLTSKLDGHAAFPRLRYFLFIGDEYRFRAVVLSEITEDEIALLSTTCVFTLFSFWITSLTYCFQNSASFLRSI